eukprot:SAG22_NODE_684_length_7918_cov_6.380356_11_plen_167_part_00
MRTSPYFAAGLLAACLLHPLNSTVGILLKDEIGGGLGRRLGAERSKQRLTSREHKRNPLALQVRVCRQAQQLASRSSFCSVDHQPTSQQPILPTEIPTTGTVRSQQLPVNTCWLGLRSPTHRAVPGGRAQGGRGHRGAAALGQCCSCRPPISIEIPNGCLQLPNTC